MDRIAEDFHDDDESLIPLPQSSTASTPVRVEYLPPSDAQLLEFMQQTGSVVSQNEFKQV